MNLVYGQLAAVGVSAPDRTCVAGQADGDQAWWLVHTRSRHEKALAADLDKAGIDYFLPLVLTRRTWSGRSFHVHLPLFPSYLFLFGCQIDRYTTLTTRHVAAIIPVHDQRQLHGDLEQIQRVCASRQAVDLYPQLCRGSRCRVIRGPLAGLEGVVLHRRGSWRVYVAVQAIGQSAELEIDPAHLEVLA